ncbi:MAG: hypothetical protein JO214_00625 [Frankiaceae bacterium]|nr:hypothetical protein [Frankiaceae bacterium]
MGTPFASTSTAPASIVRPATDAQIVRALVPMLEDRDWASSDQTAYVERAAVLKLVIRWATNVMDDATPPAISRVVHNTVGRLASHGEKVNAILAHLAEQPEQSRHQGALDAAKLYAPLSKEGASKLIGWLDAQGGKKVTATAPATDDQGWVDAETVPAGSYALTIEDSSVGNDLAFYRVDRPTEGKWAGFVFVKLELGPETQRLSIPAQKSVLRRIAEVGAREASILYGQKIEKCGVCHTKLTNKESREAGIGPDCRKKFGW